MDKKFPRTASKRFSALARAAARAGASTAWGRFVGRNSEGWGSFDPKALEGVVAQLGHLKGLPMKLGQLASYIDETLPVEARRLFATLQTQSAETSFADTEATLREELGAAANTLLGHLERRPVASASIGQVYRASAGPEQWAVKVQYRGIAEAIGAEMKAAATGINAAQVLMPGVDLQSFVREMRARLVEECDYLLEAERQRTFGRLFAGHPTLEIPGVIDEYSRRRLLTTVWKDGMAFEAWLATSPSQDERNRFGAALYEFYIATLYREGLFNADPHPGNYLFGDKLVILDFGCVRSFTPEQVGAFVRLRDAVLGDDAGDLRQALIGIGAHDPATAEQLDAARTLMRAFFAPMLRDQSMRIEPAQNTELSALMRDKMRLMKLGLPGELLFLFRIKFGLYAVLARMGAEANWYALEQAARPSELSPPTPRGRTSS